MIIIIMMLAARVTPDHDDARDDPIDSIASGYQQLGLAGANVHKHA
jgi:hypothetical protein